MKILTRKVVKTYTESVNLETGEIRTRIVKGWADSIRETYHDENAKLLNFAESERLWMKKTGKSDTDLIER